MAHFEHLDENLRSSWTHTLVSTIVLSRIAAQLSPNEQPSCRDRVIIRGRWVGAVPKRYGSAIQTHLPASNTELFSCQRIALVMWKGGAKDVHGCTSLFECSPLNPNESPSGLSNGISCLGADVVFIILLTKNKMLKQRLKWRYMPSWIPGCLDEIIPQSKAERRNSAASLFEK